MIDFIRTDTVEEFRQVARISHIAIMEKEMDSINMRILVKMVNAPGIKCRSASNDAMHFISLSEKKFC